MEIPDEKGHRMKTWLVAGLMIVAIRMAAHSQEPKREQKQASELKAGLCKIDVTNKTIRVVPWDSAGKAWKQDSARVLSWKDSTQLVNGRNTLTMAELIAGKSLGEIKTLADLRGERGILYIEKAKDKEAIKKVEIFGAFAGESFPAYTNIDSGQTSVGSMKIPCGDDENK
jgi:hypothetical protein